MSGEHWSNFQAITDCIPLTVIETKGEKQVDSISPLRSGDLENVAITGDGIFDGGGDAWRPLRKDKVNQTDWQALVKSGGALDERGDTWWPGRAAMNGEALVKSLRSAGSLNPAD